MITLALLIAAVVVMGWLLYWPEVRATLNRVLDEVDSD